MMFLTFAEKCGDLGASALAGGCAAAANKRSFTKDASAIVPRPVRHSLKKCRRVIAAKVSNLSFRLSSSLITCHSSLLCNRLVQVQQHIRNNGPGSFFPDWSALGPWQVTHQG